ncbi:heparinase II/III family protein [Pelagibacterium sp. H642]|uniref:heparinase II/III family protein n=1 Tax=Pelagibacterium sp. H642 TaxID=1881069 RepID=UPI002816327F|nr:heparinase II/III family protein [Pelagibacterium sp. H642]WMT92361.1 heparinase II/III family protein [Pelagibacterium sp. H642]
MGVFEVLRFGLRRAGLGLADRTVTHALFSWTWSGADAGRFVPRLAEFRPADAQTVIEMMEGKYLLSGRLVETGGQSPFAVDTEADDWFEDLHSFGWLRHFSALTDPGQRAFARTLVLDWIARFGTFERDAWDVFITARRVLNWLKSFSLLAEGATAEQMRAIARSLSVQISSLKVRAAFVSDPLERLMVEIALAGAALSESEESRELAAHIERLGMLLEGGLDDDGLVKSRSPFAQIQILSEIIPVNQVLGQRHGTVSSGIARRIEAMHRALEKLVLGTREPVYANGCGQVPVELVLAIAAQSGVRATGSGLCGGYGILVDGPGKVVADSGQVPPVEFAADAHAGALSFEYACGSTLVAGNCGPAPGQLAESRNLFRHTSAHSAPTIEDMSSAGIGRSGALQLRGAPPQITLEAQENAVEMRSGAYRDRYGLDIVRRLTLMGGGQTLVGQDRFMAAGRTARQQGMFSIRFHLAPGVVTERSSGEDLIRMIYRNGEAWSFLWEGASADIEDSVRHSAHFGLIKTRQIVLHGTARNEAEIAWVFTRQS